MKAMAQNPPLLERYRWIILLGMGLLILAVFAFFLFDQDEPVAITINVPPPTETHTPIPPIEIYVTGAVTNPESRHTLPPDSRVEDAIEAAGGASEEADLSLVNLAKPLQDGEQVHVPKKGEQIAVPSAGGVTTVAILDLNTATLEELDALPGVGPSTAQAIIDYRTQIGGFTSVDELDNVSGIGASTLEQIRPLVTVTGVGGEATEVPTEIPATATNTPAPTDTPRPTHTPAPTATPMPTDPPLVNINTATVEELMELPGIGETTAQAIFTYREENGLFTTIDELDNVPGIGPATLDEIRPFVTIED